MSNQEIIASLGLKLNANLTADLDEQLADVEEVMELEAEEEEANVEASEKLALAAYAGYIVAKFHPGPTGRGRCHKDGTGAFYSSKSVHGLKGKYTLVVKRLTVKLYRDGHKVWSGKGVQKGLSGTWEITF